MREAAQDKQNGTRIASSATFSRRFTSAIRSLIEQQNYAAWIESLSPILTEAGFAESDLADERSVRSRFNKLGAGHKATLSMLTDLYKEIEPDSLVVIDEPENHSHVSEGLSIAMLWRGNRADGQTKTRHDQAAAPHFAQDFRRGPHGGWSVWD